MSGDKTKYSTTHCRCWEIKRRDGQVIGATDHDRPLQFGGTDFRPEMSLSPSALQVSTGLSVDNAEIVGALSDASLNEADIAAGLYDGASVKQWEVNWTSPEDRHLIFKGTIADIRRSGSGFVAEVHGLTDPLNHPRGRRFQRQCDAILGDARCGIDLSAGGFTWEAEIIRQPDERRVLLPENADHADGAFQHGRLFAGSEGAKPFLIQSDNIQNDGSRVIALWEPIGDLPAGACVRLEVGCDKSPTTCQSRFNNVINFRGFPALPSEDLLIRPAKAGEGKR